MVASKTEKENESIQNNSNGKFWKRNQTTKEEKKSTQSVSFRSLFRYASLLELFYLLIGIIASAIFGVVLPLILLIYGNTINIFINQSSNLCSLNLTSLSEQSCPSNVTLTTVNFYTNIKFCNLTQFNLTSMDHDLTDAGRMPTILSVILAFVVIVSGYIRMACLSILAAKQSRTIRNVFFRSIFNKDLVYFDKHKTGELNLVLTENINKIHEGMSGKFASAIEMIVTALSCFIIGFVRGWKLALVILSLSPLIVVSLMILFKICARLTVEELKAYGLAGNIAEEVISSIRTVFSYNGQEKEIERYEKHLDKARECGTKKSFADGLSRGITFLLLYSIYALGFWYGTKLIREENYNIGDVFTIFLSINFGVFCLGQANPFFQAISEARTAAFSVWQLIDESSTINNNSENGLKKDEFNGDIRFSNVHFSYPSRSDISILNHLSFDVQCGQTIALVGSSGSGKSTCIQLLQRFYDPQAGSITIDGRSVSEYDLKWLRQHIGVVSQEPILFHTTIRQNILLGCESATDEQIHDAAKMANAHDFIMTLPHKYETEVGERGSALSGGQKQRIAIARALLGNPKILLLDEATSALDNESEKIVQEALNRAAQGRTTLIIAHRLSTIRHVDKIIVMQQGEVVEEGDHETLIKNQGAYFKLVEQQQQQPTELFVVTQRKRGSTIVSVASSYLSALNTLEEDDDDTTKEEEIKIKKQNITLALLKMNKSEWYLLLIGCIAGALIGVHEVAYAIVQTKLAVIFQECDVNEQKRRVSLLVIIYIILGVCCLAFNSIEGYVFGRSGEALTKRLRSQAFRSILRQEVNFFDQPNHSTGVLCARLASDASAVQGATGLRFGSILEHLFTIVFGTIVGLFYSWRLTLCMLPFIPFIIIAGVLQIHLTTRIVEKQKHIQESINKLTTETIQNVRTVFSLTKEDHFCEEYAQKLDCVYKSSLKHIHILSITFGVSSSFIYFSIAAFIALSMLFVEQGLNSFEDIFIVVNGVVFAARNINRALTLLPDYGKAIEAAQNIFTLINRKPVIDNESKDGDEIANFQGQIAFNQVYFVYPNRPEAIVLQKFKLNIEPNQKIAFVGTSGCGKSTAIQLIERFYDPNDGSLSVDSKDIRSLNLHWYRSQIGFVSQEPVLFNMSIRDNIAYGDNSRNDISIEEIIEVAKQANIHEFIQTLPQGYETNCGAKGVHLSGGQKQRIAIARALIRNPKILLLDEATSALDSENEKIVQEALDRAQENRTSITIAHRLSTVRNADLICVVQRGVIVESGSHDKLMALGGQYYRLVQRKFND